MRKYSSILCIILSVVMLMASSVSVLAKTKAQLQAELNNKSKQKKEIQARIDQLKKESQSVLDQKVRIDNEIMLVQEEIDELEAIIDETQANINTKQEEIQSVQEEIEKYDEVFKIRVRVMYENQNADYLQILLSSKSLSDFLLKMDLITQILSNDKEILTRMAENRQKLVEDKAALEEEKESNVSAKEIVVEKQQALKEKSEQQEALVEKFKEEVEQGNEDLKKTEEAAKELTDEIKKIEASESKNPTLNVPKTYAGGKFAWPSSCHIITSPFGTRYLRGSSNFHTGIDIGASFGTDITAAADGTVIISGWHSSYGNYIVISHGSGYTTLYAHSSKLLVSKGASVSRGQSIAKVGSTGNSTGPHIHFEIRINGEYQNPLSYLP